MRKLLLLPCFFISQSLLANDLIWTDISPSQQFKAIGTSNSTETKNQRLLKLDLLQLQKVLSTSSASNAEVKHLSLPLPDGQQMQLNLNQPVLCRKRFQNAIPRFALGRYLAPITLQLMEELI